MVAEVGGWGEGGVHARSVVDVGLAVVSTLSEAHNLFWSHLPLSLPLCPLSLAHHPHLLRERERERWRNVSQ